MLEMELKSVQYLKRICENYSATHRIYYNQLAEQFEKLMGYIVEDFSKGATVTQVQRHAAPSMFSILI